MGIIFFHIIEVEALLASDRACIKSANAVKCKSGLFPQNKDHRARNRDLSSNYVGTS